MMNTHPYAQIETRGFWNEDSHTLQFRMLGDYIKGRDISFILASRTYSSIFRHRTALVLRSILQSRTVAVLRICGAEQLLRQVPDLIRDWR